MNEWQVKPKKQFSQNFLVDTAICNTILQTFNATSTDTIIEVGPGTGVISESLAASGCDYTAIELDSRLIEPLTQLLNPYPKAKVLHQDALAFDYQNFHTNYRLIGNLPYHISTALMRRFIIATPAISDLLLLTQLEVAERLTANSGKARGWLSVLRECFYCAEIVQIIEGDSFYPPPKVKSALTQFHRLEQPVIDVSNIADFSQLLKIAFHNKRKTLYNNFRQVIPKTLWSEINIDSSLRAEQLPLNDFVRLFNAYLTHTPHTKLT